MKNGPLRGIVGCFHALVRFGNLDQNVQRTTSEVNRRGWACHATDEQEKIAWLNQFADHPLNDRQRLALVYLRQHGQITNPDYRRLNRVDPLVAGRELRNLVESALVEQEGTRRWTSYRLLVSPEMPSQIEVSTEEKEILAWISERKSITNKECRQLLGVGPTRAY